MIDLFTEINPSDDELPVVNPWSKPIGFITWGFILTTFHLNLLKLQYILPTIGVVLIFIGFRSLRSENKYFKMAWILSIFRLLYHLLDLILISSPLTIIKFLEGNLGIFMLVVQITMFLLYHAALKETYKRADRIMEGNPLIWISWWTAVLGLLALSSVSSSWLIAIPMMIFYIGIANALYRIGDSLDDARYLIRNADIKISNRSFGWSYILISLAIVVISSVFFNHMKLDSKEYSSPIPTAAREQLMAINFPSEALLHLSNDDVLLISDAINVEVFNELLMFDPIEVQHEDTSEGYTQITNSYNPGKQNMQATTIYVEMPEKEIYVMQYFAWKDGKPFWQDGITVSLGEDFDNLKLVSSGLFYDKNGQKYAAEFPRLTAEEVTVNTMFGRNTGPLISGALSYPYRSQNQGGYLLYGYEVEEEIYLTYSVFNYMHHETPTLLPYRKIEDIMFQDGFSFDDRIKQFYTTYRSLGLQQ